LWLLLFHEDGDPAGTKTVTSSMVHRRCGFIASAVDTHASCAEKDDDAAADGGDDEVVLRLAAAAAAAESPSCADIAAAAAAVVVAGGAAGTSGPMATCKINEGPNFRELVYFTAC
jgi:hypothetical protein